VTSTPNLAIRLHSIASLKPNPRNPRLHSKKQIRQIAKSIETFGFNVPLLINRDSQVVAGHGRLEAAKILGMREVPAISLGHLSEAQAEAFLIADNRLTENAEWDDKLLAESFKQLAELDLNFSLETTGFEMAEIDLLIEDAEISSDAKADPADEIPATAIERAVSKRGDLWILGRHRIFCGSSLEPSSYETLLAGDKAAMVFTDSAVQRSH
jgi:ParB-like chromosome segregation protein Spo0J